MSPLLRAILCSLGCSFLFVTHYYIAKEVLTVISPVALGALRGIVGGFFLLLLSRSNFGMKTLKSNPLIIVMIALSGFCLNQVAFLYGLKGSSPLHTALIMNTIPLFTAIISMTFKIESFKWNKLLGVVLGLSMVCVLSFVQIENTSAPSSSISTGVLYLITSVLLLACSIVLTKNLILKNGNAFAISGLMLFIGGVFLLPLAYQDISAVSAYFLSGKKQMFFIFYEVLVSTTLVYILNAEALRHLSPTQSLGFNYTQPVFAALIGMVLFSTYPTITFLPILLGIIISGYLILKDRLKSPS